jgi:hypothetical protein
MLHFGRSDDLRLQRLIQCIGNLIKRFMLEKIADIAS